MQKRKKASGLVEESLSLSLLIRLGFHLCKIYIYTRWREQARALDGCVGKIITAHGT
jgi:hypothetical protein